MWSTLQQRQSVLQLLMNEQERLQKKLASLQTDVLEHTHKRNEFEKKLTKEQRDVAKLDEFSFSNMMRKWKGTQEDVRDQEMAEAASVELKWNEAVKMVRDLEVETDTIRKELADIRFRDLHANWQRLMKEKELWLKVNSPKDKALMEELYERKTVVQTMLWEIEEAREAGSKANVLLSYAISQLQSARNYSTWDTFLGGGMIVTAMKHGAIDDSEDTIHKAQMALHRFRTEVKDVQALEANTFIVERGEFIKMADYFFDDIFSEWTIHSRISKSQANLQNTVKEVVKVMHSLAGKKNVLDAELSEIEAKRKQLIEA
ncbi:hypothetical protein [Paenisporosarcina sp. NPDC076898]|uniref:hypothetical protein n=1 Tax=unclassified Paenisporosarcina TaxID=2642018 RepID=UPI003D07A5E4